MKKGLLTTCLCSGAQPRTCMSPNCPNIPHHWGTYFLDCSEMFIFYAFIDDYYKHERVHFRENRIWCGVTFSVWFRLAWTWNNIFHPQNSRRWKRGTVAWLLGGTSQGMSLMESQWMITGNITDNPRDQSQVSIIMLLCLAVLRCTLFTLAMSQGTALLITVSGAALEFWRF